MKSIVACALLVSTVATANAALPKGVPLKAISPIVQGYLDKTTCVDEDKIDPKLVTRFIDKANNVDGYVAVMSADLTCAGGSGTVAPALVLVQAASGQAGMGDEISYLKVDTAMSQPTAVSNMPVRALTSIYQKDGVLYATALEYGKDDANCCPSVKSVYRISLLKKSINVSKDDKRDVYTWDFMKMK